MSRYLFHTDLSCGFSNKGIDEENDHDENVLFTDINEMLMARETTETEAVEPVNNIFEFLVRDGFTIHLRRVKNVDELFHKGYIELREDGKIYVNKRITAQYLDNYLMRITDMAVVNGKVVFNYDLAEPNKEQKKLTGAFKGHYLVGEDALDRTMKTIVSKVPNAFTLESVYTPINTDKVRVGVINGHFNGGSLICIEDVNKNVRYKFLDGVLLYREKGEVSIDFNGHKIIVKN